MSTIKKLLYFLTPKERKHVLLLLVMIMMMALLDMIGVASILPFMAVLTEPSIVEENFILKNLFQALSVFGVQTSQDFLFALGVIVFMLLILTITFRAITSYLKLRFITLQQQRISKRLKESYLNQPYTWFLQQHSANLSKNILTEVGIVVQKTIFPILNIFIN